MTALPVEGRIARARRERLLASFVDRSAEMLLFEQVLDQNDLPVMVVSAESGMGKTSLMMRMVHECALRGLSRAELSWSDLDVMDYMSVLRRLRDALGASHFGHFTDLINYYTDGSYQPRLDINVNLQGGSIAVAGGAQIAGSQVGDIAGIVLRDNMIVVQRPDLGVPMEERREQLTRRFLSGLATLSGSQPVVLFFQSTEKMSEATYSWLWEQLLKPVVDGALPGVRAVVLGQRPLPADRDWVEFLARVQLKPLSATDIEDYIAKRTAGGTPLGDEARRALARMLAVVTRGRPADVASAVDLYLAQPPTAE